MVSTGVGIIRLPAIVGVGEVKICVDKEEEEGEEEEEDKEKEGACLLISTAYLN